jgi:hypothetical protein
MPSPATIGLVDLESPPQEIVREDNKNDIFTGITSTYPVSNFLKYITVHTIA